MSWCPSIDSQDGRHLFGDYQCAFCGTPSTPALQGEKCAHALEIDLSAFDGHTPGPWEVGALIHCECGSSPNCWHNFDYQRDIYPPLGESGPVAIVSGESSKDSLLIAAAPQLLAALARERESRKQAFNAGWNAAVEEIAEKAPHMRLFRLRESIRLNLRPPPEPRKVVTQDDIDRIDADSGPNRAVVKGRSERFGDSHD